ncbi:MAG TPA: hypothetical protein VLF71_01545 [Candidatus Saccharimonadales bacterium]|nr:hypothetical protein [Candidatus Saccharimonadales bacterium]
MLEQPPADPTNYARAFGTDFMLPMTWRYKREVRTGLAIDTGGMAEDALSWQPGPNDGQHILTVSVADPGSFLYGADQFIAQVARDAHSTTTGRHIHPLSSAAVQPRQFALLGEDGRPALSIHLPIDRHGLGEAYVTRDVLYAQRLHPQEATAILHNTHHRQHGVLRGIQQALTLYRAGRYRHMHKPVPPNGLDGGEKLVTEATLAAGQGIGRLALRHGIRLFHVNTAIPADLLPEISDPQDRVSLLGSFSQKWLDTRLPVVNTQYGVDSLAPISRSLRDTISFINNCNIVAPLLYGQPAPFPADIMRSIARSENGRQAENQRRQAVRARLLEWDTVTADALGLQAMLELGKYVSPTVLTKALFEAAGRERDIQHAKETAAGIIAAHPYLANVVIQLATARRHIDPALAAGLTFKVPGSRNPKSTETLESQIGFLGEIAGLPRLRHQLVERARERANNRAASAAATLKVERAPAAPVPAGQIDQKSNALTLLHGRQDANRGQHPTYTFPDETSNDCVVYVIDTDPDATVYTGLGSASTRQESKHLAAADVLRKLPKRSFGAANDHWLAAQAAREGQEGH